MTPKSNKEYDEVTISVPWGHIKGRWYGDQSVRPILALHGWLDNCGTFTKIAPLLTPYASLLCLDLPGHGYSSHLPAGICYHIMEFVRLILALMKIYQWEKVSLFGHSMSSNCAFFFASMHPDKVDMVIGLDNIRGLYYSEKQMPDLLRYIFEHNLLENERIIQRSPMNEPPSYTYAQCEQMLHEGSDFSVPLEDAKYILERNITKSLKYPEKYFFSRDRRVKFILEFNANPEMCRELIKRISKVPIPYCILRGGASTNIAAKQQFLVDYFNELNPLFEIHTVPNATHHLHLTHPQETAEIIIKFLQKYRPLEYVYAERDREKYGKAKL